MDTSILLRPLALLTSARRCYGPSARLLLCTHSRRNRWRPSRGTSHAVSYAIHHTKLETHRATRSDPEDLTTIQQSLLSPGYTGDTSHPGSPTFTAAAETSSHSVITAQSCSRARTTPPVSYWHPNHVFSLPLRLSSVCRDIHAVLTGAKAVRCQLDVDAEGMRRIWDGLANCWDDFDIVRRQGASNVTEDGVDLDRFASAWQVSNLVPFLRR